MTIFLTSNAGAVLGSRADGQNCTETNENYDWTGFGCLLGRCKDHFVDIVKFLNYISSTKLRTEPKYLLHRVISKSIVGI